MQNDLGVHTYQEIISQGEVWKATLQGFETQFQAARELFRLPFDEVIFTGCGSTYYLSLAAAATWQALTGIRARGVPASELWLFPQSILTSRRTLLVAVSRSGETSETLRALDVFRQMNGHDILAVTVYPDRALAQRAPHVLVTKCAEEESVAQTRSFSSMFLLTQAAACGAAGNAEAWSALSTVPQYIEPLLSRYESLSQSLAKDRNLERFVFLGSGANYGLACEAMLKMKEMSLSSSEAFHFMEFRHGPKSVVAPGTLLVGLLSDTAYSEEIKVLQEMRNLGATVLALVDKDQNTPADFVVEVNSGVAELQRGALYLPVLQLLAYYRACERGLNPDRPTNLDAVVRL